MVSPLTRSAVKPSSKLTSAAISRVHKVLSLPKSLGEWCRNSRNEYARSASKAAWVCFGREEPAIRASRPRSVEVVDGVAHGLGSAAQRAGYLRGAFSPRPLARRIWHRRRTKESEERSPSSNASRSFLESVRTKIGGLMTITITHSPKPVLGYALDERRKPGLPIGFSDEAGKLMADV